MKQLSVRTALILYGIGGGLAYAGWTINAALMAGWFYAIGLILFGLLMK